MLAVLASLQIHAHVDLNYPLGGEEFSPGDTVNITWTETVKHNTFNWDLFISTDGGQARTPLMEDIPLEILYYQWIVPNMPGVEVRIKIVQDNEKADYSSSSESFTISSMTGVRESNGTGSIKVYPNPLTEHAFLEFQNPENNSLSLNIYDNQGRLMRSIPDNTSGRIELRKGSLPAGFYFLRLRDGKQTRASATLVIR